jgi:hypothetical protein
MISGVFFLSPERHITILLKVPFAAFSVHFVFGCYAYNYDLGKKVKDILYTAAVVSAILMAAGSYIYCGDHASKLFFFSMHGSSLSPFAFLLGGGIICFLQGFIGEN